MDHKQLSYFLQVCEYGNLSSAAEACHVSQQALSKTIRNLEEELGVTLFKRNIRGVSLTADGESLRIMAQGYSSHHDAILRHFRQQNHEYAGRLSIGLATGIVDAWFPNGSFASLISAYPGIDFEIVCFYEDSFNRARQAFDRDIIICSNPISYPNLRVVYQAERIFSLLMMADHPLAQKEDITLADLRGTRTAISIYETPEQQHLQACLDSVGIRPAVRFGPSEIPLVQRLIRERAYVSFYAGAPEEVPEGLVQRKIKNADIRWHICIMQNTGRELGQHGRSFLKKLTSAAV